MLREFNHHNEVTGAYKAFYNRLARPGFAKFMRQMFGRLVERLSIRTLAPEGHAAVVHFKDIVIQDGSSFALKKALCHVFSGRFTTTEPAAVEVHATYSGFSDEVSAVEISSLRVAMCAGHIIDEIVTALLACASIALAFHDGMAFLLANARRSNPSATATPGDSGVV